jgi:cytidyltransferase-like protein
VDFLTFSRQKISLSSSPFFLAQGAHTMDTIYPEASVHGRFQPPHNGHLEYILEAKRRCEFLWVGIVRYNIRESLPSPVAPHRAQRMANPLTYFERVQIITEMLLDAGIPRHEFSCTPFPIDEPELLPDFMSKSIPCFTTIYEPWNREKIARLEQLGYQVVVLYERTKTAKIFEGQVIRENILSGQSDWEKMVPAATVKAVSRLNLKARLAKLANGGQNGKVENKL